MARILDRLSATSLKTKPEGLHADGGGLYLQVRDGSRSWILRFMLNGKGRYMGLGPFPDVSLAQARKLAAGYRQQLRDGVDPIEDRKQKKLELQLAASKSITFGECAERYIEAHRPGWRNKKHAAQWASTLKRYVYPTLGVLPVQTIDTGRVMKVLDPIWTTKRETATRVRQRMEAVLDWATARNYRTGDNPARWRGHLDKLLPKPSKVQAPKHFDAVHYDDLPSLFQTVSESSAVSAKALTFLILTAARSGEVRRASLNEIDLANGIWAIPAERTKSAKEHRVPLPSKALKLIEGLEHLGDETDGLLFPNSKGKPLSDTAMRKYLQEVLGQEGKTVHGFRSTFRDWAAERTNFPREVAEKALAHVVKDKTEAAYLHGDLLEHRRKLMNAWAKYCTSGAKLTGEVIPLQATA